MNARKTLRLTAIAAVLAAAGAVHAADMVLADEAPKTREQVQEELRQWKAEGIRTDDRGAYYEEMDRHTADSGLTREQVKEDLAFAKTNGLMAQDGDVGASDIEIQQQQTVMEYEREGAIARLQPAEYAEQWAAMALPAEPTAAGVPDAQQPAADYGVTTMPADTNAAVPSDVPGSMGADPAAGTLTSPAPDAAPQINDAPLPSQQPEAQPQPGMTTGEGLRPPESLSPDMTGQGLPTAPEAAPMDHPALQQQPAPTEPMVQSQPKD